jgi:hypothetical protein
LQKSAQKTSFALQHRAGGEGGVSNPKGAKRRHDVFLLLFVHKKKTFLASLRWASTRSAIRAFLFQVLNATSVSIDRTSENTTAK